MDKCIIFRSVLIYLLLCYGKKFVDANERNQTGSISQQNSSSNTQKFTRSQESYPLNQSTGFLQTSDQNHRLQEGSQNFTEITLNRKHHNQSVQLIVLNIDIRNSTNEVVYKPEPDGTHSFICRDGFLIKEVIRGGKVGWRPKNQDYAYGMIFIENFEGRPKLTALIENNLNQPQQPQHNVQQTNLPQPEEESPVSTSDVGLDDIFVVDRNGSPGSGDSDDVEVRRDQRNRSYVSEHYGIDPDSSDSELDNRSPKRRPVSSDGSYGYDYGNGYHNIPVDKSRVRGHQEEYDSYGYEPKNRRTRIPRASNHGRVSEVKNIIVLDVGIADYVGYDVIEKANNVIFKAKQTFLFNKVKNGNKVIWEPKKPGDYADKVLAKIGKNNEVKYDVFIYEQPVLEEEEEEEIQVQVQKRQASRPVEPPQHTPSKVYAPEVNILTVDGTNALRINDESQYSVTKHNNILKYQFVDSAKCVEVKYSRETVWKAEEYYPISVTFNRGEGSFVIDFGTAYVHCEKHGNMWQNVLHKYNAHNKQMGVKYNHSYPRDVTEQVEPKKDLSLMAHKATAVVDIDTKKSMNEFEFSKKSDDCGTYTPKHNFIFKVVKGSVSRIGGKVDIWHPDSEDEYVTKVTIDGIGFNSKVNNATLFLANGNIKHFTILKKSWVEVDPSVILNIENKTTTCEYDYYTEGKTQTFTPKGHFLFQGIKQTVGSSCRKAEVDIWETNDPLEYGTKVMVVSTTQSEKYVVMFLLNRHYKLFYKSGKNSMWKDESDNPSTVSNLKLLGIDVGDPRNYGIKNGQKKGTHVSELITTGGGEAGQGDRQYVAHGSLDTNFQGDPTMNYSDSNLRNMRQESEPVVYSRRAAGAAGPVRTAHTVRKVVVEHVPCNPGQIYDSEESEITYRDSATSTSEDSEDETHRRHSEWISLRH